MIDFEKLHCNCGGKFSIMKYRNGTYRYACSRCGTKMVPDNSYMELVNELVLAERRRKNTLTLTTESDTIKPQKKSRRK